MSLPSCSLHSSCTFHLSPLLALRCHLTFVSAWLCRPGCCRIHLVRARPCASTPVLYSISKRLWLSARCFRHLSLSCSSPAGSLASVSISACPPSCRRRRVVLPAQQSVQASIFKTQLDLSWTCRAWTGLYRTATTTTIILEAPPLGQSQIVGFCTSSRYTDTFKAFIAHSRIQPRAHCHQSSPSIPLTRVDIEDTAQAASIPPGQASWFSTLTIVGALVHTPVKVVSAHFPEPSHRLVLNPPPWL